MNKEKAPLEATLPNEMVLVKEERTKALPHVMATPKENLPPPAAEPIIPPVVGQDALKEVGEYRLVNLIGSGAMGEIHLAEYRGKNTEGKQIPKFVAIKLLSPKIQADDTARQRFIQEAKVHNQLCKESPHPNIVQIYDIGYCPKSGRLYLVMEFIEGESLEKWLAARGPLSERHALQIAIGVGHALEHAFKQHIIHRDLKPANILIDKKSRKVKVTDFGLGKILEEKGVTLSGEFMGTPYYMPPEQIHNPKDVDYRADIYALGGTLYHMLCGSPPYSEFKRTLDILKAKMSHEPISLKEYLPDIPDAVVSLVEKAMARDKNARFETAAKMVDGMQKILDMLKTKA